MSEPTATIDWNALADRKAAEMIERADVFTVTQGDYEKLLALVGCAYLQGRRDELHATLAGLRGDGE